ncbi:MAG: hypothetical protein GW946_03405 [Candidatus Pacebacteria bacterium]|nr:hypothetical protein [Candidatus Paceibacterota bacterium]PIR59936.1 MAG: hypothetical protein COU67_04095 [Candidatus Pacebacteria bacterium CG10_big_fil_rev_8_21_14_0_10_44_54]
MKKVLSNQLVLLISALFIIFAIVSMRQNDNKIINQDQNLTQIDQKNRELRQEISQLENEIKAATSDFAKEKLLRDELLLQKPGEYVVLLDESVSEETASEPIKQESEQSVWQQWQEVLW